jgi:tetratricopeptide (TPR) repeat protein
MGEDLRAMGRLREALAHQDRAIRLLTERLGSRHPRLGAPLAYKGLTLFDLRKRRQAIPFLERAIDLLPPAHADRALAVMALARSLEPRRPRSRRVKLLVVEAMTRFASVQATRELDRAAAYLRRGDRR